MTKKEIRSIVFAMDEVVDITHEQKQMIIKLLEMKKFYDTDFLIGRISKDVQWQLFGR